MLNASAAVAITAASANGFEYSPLQSPYARLGPKHSLRQLKSVFGIRAGHVSSDIEEPSKIVMRQGLKGFLCASPPPFRM